MIQPPDPANDELPSYITVRFSPERLPSGAINLEDLSQFLTGLQRTLDAKVRHDQGIDNIESERFDIFRFVIFGIREGSIECDIGFNIFNNVSALEGAIEIGGTLLLAKFLSGAAEEAGKRSIDAVAKLASQLTLSHRRYLRDFLAFLRNATSSDPKLIDSDLLERAEKGLKDMSQVGAKEAYQREGITIRGNGRGESPILFDLAAKTRIVEFLDTEVAGDEVIILRGRVTALDLDQNTFRVLDVDRKERIRCRYAESQQDIVLNVATPSSFIAVTGLPHFRKGSDKTWPPLYIKVQDMGPMPTLWNMVEQAQ